MNPLCSDKYTVQILCSDVTLNSPCLDEETVTENKSRKLAPWQAEILNNFFNNESHPTSHNPTKDEIKMLSLQTRRKETSVKRWFYYKKTQLNKSNITREATTTTTNPLCSDIETITENKSRKIAPWQAKILNDFFNDHSHKPTKNDIRQLSLQTDRTEKSVKKWFYQKVAE